MYSTKIVNETNGDDWKTKKNVKKIQQNESMRNERWMEQKVRFSKKITFKNSLELKIHMNKNSQNVWIIQALKDYIFLNLFEI